MLYNLILQHLIILLSKHTLLSNTTGDGNTTVGSSSLDANTTGGNQTAVGMSNLTTGVQYGAGNTAIGRQSLEYLTTGLIIFPWVMLLVDMLQLLVRKSKCYFR